MLGEVIDVNAGVHTLFDSITTFPGVVECPQLSIFLLPLAASVHCLQIDLLCPALSLLRSGNAIVLSWPTSFSGFTLQAATNSIAAPSWTTVTNVPALLNGQYLVTNNTSGTLKFYRLAK